jgi:hypothetical protein
LEIARSKLPQRVTVTAQERNRLVKLGAKLGRALDKLVTIVHPDTPRRWIRESKKSGKKEPVKRGRRRTAEDIRKLIIKLAKENEWGCTRILGELRKLSAGSNAESGSSACRGTTLRAAAGRPRTSAASERNRVAHTHETNA